MAARSVLLLGFPDAQTLDLTGPWEVFATADRLRGGGAYALELLAREPAVRTSSGLELASPGPLPELPPPMDTLIVAGGSGVDAALADRALVAWVARAAGRARRVASVCTGAFFLAEAGLLDGRRATTHWGACERLARDYPAVHVEADAIFVRDGDVWTSAGVTAGMDLALALVEEDHGRELALAVARMLVLFLKRPGGQSQFSTHLSAQVAEREPLREAQAWALAHLDADLSVPALAARAGMSPRNFARIFTREVGETPARWVEAARFEAARRALEETARNVDVIADECGLGSAESMRRIFLKRIRTSPTQYRARFRDGADREEIAS